MKNSIKKVRFVFFLVFLLISPSAWGADLEITITNSTHGSYFTPFLIVAHDSTLDIFEVGATASANLQAMAEGGAISGLSGDAAAAGADIVENPAGGLLAPGNSVTAALTTSAGNAYLSLVAMILPTNDGFVGLDTLEFPTVAGTYTYYLPGYDAGTEANNELVVDGSGAPGVLGIPADPTGLAGSGGTGVTTTEVNQTVHIHRGVLGEASPGGVVSDLINSAHRWLNPIVKLVIEVR